MQFSDTWVMQRLIGRIIEKRNEAEVKVTYFRNMGDSLNEQAWQAIYKEHTDLPRFKDEMFQVQRNGGYLYTDL